MATIIAPTTPTAATPAAEPVITGVLHPVFKVSYGQKDITNDITPFITDVTYTDYDSGQSDELEITLEDTDARWKNAWYPGKGDTLTLEFGYEGLTLTKTEPFEIDEIEFSGPPDTVRLKALATGPKGDVRTRKSTAYEKTTLDKIALKVAKRNKFELVGKIEPIQIDRVTQYHERDLPFLTRIGKEYGYIFKVTGKKLVFSKIAALHELPTVSKVARTDLLNYRFTDKIKDVPKKASVRYHNPQVKRVVKTSVDAPNDSTSGDTEKICVRAPNGNVAKAKAQALLDTKASLQTTGSVAIIGNNKACALNNIDIEGFGKLDGTYNITNSRHHMDRSGGYATELEWKRVKVKKDPKATKPPPKKRKGLPLKQYKPATKKSGAR